MNNTYPPSGEYYYAPGFVPAPGAFPTPPPRVSTPVFKNNLRGLRRLSITAGLCVLGFIGLQFAVNFALFFLGLGDEYSSNLLFQNAFGAVYSVICVFLPFFAVSLSMNEKTRTQTLLFGKPYATGLMLLAVPAGFMFCMAGNYATNALVTLMDSAGVQLTAPESPVPSSALGMVFYVVQIAFIPALIEEFALRGVVMQPLRKYGDRFAVLMSAMVFALMHGNMVQAPFAFIAGIAIGYFVIATGSIWTGVLIHFANNLFSALLSLANANSTLALDTPYAVFMTVCFVGGLACCLIFALHAKRYKLRGPAVPAGAFQRFLNYVFTLPMMLALAAIAYITMDWIAFTG